ncbi:hypothetical protein, partial [Glaesserella parasuis]|uniref:hypothetical protein n=1 Tax=Glaesserella parasuis TaxID=738 RepID=UPI003F2B0D7D
QMLVGDTIIINEYPNHEQFSINAINGNVITLGVSGNPTTTTTTSLNHANQVPVRCQAEVIGSMYGDPLRDYAAFANIVTASNCLIENCSVFAMV